mmetsp:Transcript_16464/g.23902  ORF Transcript_16464/g.23902 Transcript_16464/m.23902 type:complete len:641 (-) Transcript_16464:34-1956(-)
MKHRCLIILVSCLLDNYSSGFVVLPQAQHQRTSPRRRFAYQLYQSTSQTLELDTMTIKELRELIKKRNLNQRGLMTKLKRKQDIVEYIRANLASPEEIEDIPQPQTTSTSAEESNVSTAEQSQHNQNEELQPRLRNLAMPALEDENSEGLSAKDQIRRRVYQLYPQLREQNCTGIGEDDIRQHQHPMLKNSTGSDMDIIFVGTASCTPSVTRGVSCTALRLNWPRRSKPSKENQKDIKTTDFETGTWLFDVGEGTQLQIQQSNLVRPKKINKIFLTHAHGDHTFGLPGLMCLMGVNWGRDSPPLEIYGPEGLRMWLRVAIRYSVARIVPRYRVHEIKKIPLAPEWKKTDTGKFYFNPNRIEPFANRRQFIDSRDAESWHVLHDRIHLERSARYNEIEGGRNIFPKFNHSMSADGAPVWEIEDDDDVRVYAAPMSHGVPCVGYVVEEQSRPGRLRNELVEPIVKRNYELLKEAGFRMPMKAMAVIKNLPQGSSFTFPDGTVVTQEEAVEPPRKGRKIAICGDTSDARALAGLAQDADVLIHEATNAYLPGTDKDTNMKSVTYEAMRHGHSTPQIAANFARKINAKKLLLNHFSARYLGNQAIENMSIMQRIEDQARESSGYDAASVAAAWDFMHLNVPRSE